MSDIPVDIRRFEMLSILSVLVASSRFCRSPRWAVWSHPRRGHRDRFDADHLAWAQELGTLRNARNGRSWRRIHGLGSRISGASVPSHHSGRKLYAIVSDSPLIHAAIGEMA